MFVDAMYDRPLRSRSRAALFSRASSALLCAAIAYCTNWPTARNAVAETPPRSTSARPAPPVAAAIGHIEHSQGAARIERGGPAQQASAGGDVLRGDRLETTGEARLSIKLGDGTRLALGERTSLTIRQFVAEQGRRTGAVLLHLTRGVLRLTATPAKKPLNKRIEVRTAAATVEGAVYDAILKVSGRALSLVVLEGRLEIRNIAGSLEIDIPRQGVDRVTASAAPNAAIGWHRDRIKQLLVEVEGR